MVNTINRDLRRWALSEQHATYVDFPAFQDDINTLPEFLIGGVEIANMEQSKSAPTVLFQDGTHPRAVGNGIVVNMILEGINRTTGMNLPMLTDREILISAGIGDRFVRVTFTRRIYFGTCTTVFQ